MFIVKPQDPEVLLNLIRQVINDEPEGKISSPKQDARDLDERHLWALTDKLHKKVQDLEIMNNALQESNEELRDFVHIVSHDFQEPLRKIYLFSDLLQGQCQDLNEKGAFYLERLQHSVKRMQDLMHDLVKYSKVVPSISRSIQSVNLEDIIQNVKIDLEILLNETNGKVEIEP